MNAALPPAIVPASAIARATGAHALIQLGREFAAAGWVPASSGNFSLRLQSDQVLMTRSGVEKGQLQEDDFLCVDPSQPAPPAASAEAPLHLALYSQQPQIGCVLHVHSRAAAVLSRLCLARGDSAVVLEGWELQKALAGQHTHEAQVCVPVFANAQDTSALAQQISAALPAFAGACGYLLAGHGLYAWGRTAAEARRHVVAFDALFQCQLDLGRT